MKIIHLSDLHLNSLYKKSNLDEIKKIDMNSPGMVDRKPVKVTIVIPIVFSLS